jgi:hypothetical protein
MMERTEFILAATLAFLLFCMAVVMGCMPGSWIELAAGGTAGGAEGRLTDVWIPLGTWLDIGGVRFKVVFEREPVTELPVFTLLEPPATIVSTAKLTLGEKELRGPDVTVTIKDYDFLVARGMTWGGRILCDISVKRRINPSMSVYTPELSFYRGMLYSLETVQVQNILIWRDLEIVTGVLRPPAFMAPMTLTLAFSGYGSDELKEPVYVELKIDWFPDDIPVSERLTARDFEEMRAKRYQTKLVRVWKGEKFRVVFELNDWVTKRADLYARVGTEPERKIGSGTWEGVDCIERVKIWDSWLENLNIEFSNVWQALVTQKEVFEKWTENAVKAYKGLEEYFNRQLDLMENKIVELAESVGEALRKHENMTREQLEAIRDWMLTNLRGLTKPAVVVYAPQTVYSGVPNAFSIQPLNAVVTDVRLEDASGVLWTGISTFFTATPRIPGSGLKLTVTYTGTVGEWAGKTFTKVYDIPFEYLTAVTWENRQPVVVPPPEPLIKAWHLLAVGAVVFATVLGVGLWRRR